MKVPSAGLFPLAMQCALRVTVYRYAKMGLRLQSPPRHVKNGVATKKKGRVVCVQDYCHANHKLYVCHVTDPQEDTLGGAITVFTSRQQRFIAFGVLQFQKWEFLGNSGNLWMRFDTIYLQVHFRINVAVYTTVGIRCKTLCRGMDRKMGKPDLLLQHSSKNKKTSVQYMAISHVLAL